MTDRGESSRRGEAPRGVRRWCEDFASRAGTYPFPLRTPAHGWPARPKRTRYFVAAPLARGSRHVRLRRFLKWEKRQPIQGFLKIFRNYPCRAERCRLLVRRMGVIRVAVSSPSVIKSTPTDPAPAHKCRIDGARSWKTRRLNPQIFFDRRMTHYRVASQARTMGKCRWICRQ
jgi:hypothetical protein